MAANKPIIEYCEGKDQDDRAALLAAFYRLVGTHARREVSDLHVRELLTYVLHCDRDGRGMPLSYDDVGDQLCCERSTARRVVDRAEQVYGLLERIEDRYSRGGQAPNRYRVDWQRVRAVNRGELGTSAPRPDADTRHDLDSAASVAMGGRPAATTAHPGATRAQAAATREHPGATRAQPYKEYTLCETLSSSLTTTDAVGVVREQAGGVVVSEDRDFSKEEQAWRSYAAELTALHMSPQGAQVAIDAARAAGMSHGRAIELLALYHRLRSRDRRVNAGWLNRWLRGLSQPPDSDAPQRTQLGQRGDAMPRERIRGLVGSGEIIRSGRRRGLSDEEILAELRAAGFDGWP